jgi:hypothetical protein
VIAVFSIKERLLGIAFISVIGPMALLGYWLIVILGLFGKTKRARQGVRALDHFVNATLFDGYAWESLSSHAWRVRKRPWAKVIISMTDIFQKDHCKYANKREQPLIDLMLEKNLHHQTIGK